MTLEIKNGRYKTRDGRTAAIDSVRKNSTFPFSGDILGYDTHAREISQSWYEGGLFFEGQESPEDLVEFIGPLTAEDALAADECPLPAPPTTTAAAPAEETEEAAPPASQTAGAEDDYDANFIRDQFALATLNASLMHARNICCLGSGNEEAIQGMAEDCYVMADAMMEARKKKA